MVKGWALADVTSAPTSPSGSNGAVQFNNSKRFGADSNLTYSTTTKTLTVPEVAASTFATITLLSFQDGTTMTTAASGNGGGGGGGGSGYAVEPATKTFLLNQGARLSTFNVTGLSPGVMRIVATSSNAATGLVSISTETNLAVTAPITLTTNTIGIDTSSASGVMVISSMTAYMTQSSATLNFLTKSSATANYFPLVSSTTLLTTSSASATYFPLVSSTTLLTTSSASANYFPLVSSTTLLTTSSATLNYLALSSASATYFNKNSVYVASVNVSGGLGITSNGTNGSAPTISLPAISLSSGVTGSLPAASIAAGNLGPSVVASSASQTMLVSSFNVSGVTAGSYTNMNATIDAFGHITTASNGSAGGGGGAATLAVGTGTASNFTNNITSPTAAISFHGNLFRTTTNGTTSFVTLDTSTANGLLMISSAAGTYLTQSSVTATYLQLSSAAATYQYRGTYLTTTAGLGGPVAVGTGSVTSFTNIVSTPANGISFEGMQFRVTNLSGTTAYVLIDTMSSTGLMAISSMTNYVTQSSATSNYVTLSSAAATYFNKNSVYISSINVSGGLGISANGTSGAAPTISLPAISLSSGVTGSLPAASVAAGSLGPSVLVSSLTKVVGAGSCTNCNATFNDQGQVTTFTNGSAGGGGASTLAIGTGTAANFTTNVTSPTAAVSFLGSQFNSTTNGTTNFLTLNQTSVTVQGVLLAGPNITLTPGSGSLTIAATGGSGDMVLASTQTSSGAKTFSSSTTINGPLLLNGIAGISGRYAMTNGSGTAPSWATINTTVNTSTFSAPVGIGFTTTELVVATVTITPSSTGSKLVVMGNVSLAKDLGTTARIWTMRLRRGGDQTPANNVAISTSVHTSGIIANTTFFMEVDAIDAPNTVSLTTFTVTMVCGAGISTVTIANLDVFELGAAGPQGSQGIQGVTGATGAAGNAGTFSQWNSADFIVNITTNAIYTTISTVPAYGQNQFSGTISSTTNRVFLKYFADGKFDTSTDLTGFLSVTLGGVDTSSQTFRITIASVTPGQAIDSNQTTFGNEVVVAVSTSSGGMWSEATTSTFTLTGWKSYIVPATNYWIQIARQGDSTTLDTSQIVSYFDKYYMTWGRSQ